MKTALIVGCAANVWEDVKAAQQLTAFDAVYCVKQAGVYWPTRFNVWTTLHPEWADRYEADRAALGYPNGYEIVAPLAKEIGLHAKKGRVGRRVSYLFPSQLKSRDGASASSGIYAAKVAVEDGFRCVLAGIPMDANAGHFLPHETNTQGQLRGNIWLHRDSFLHGFDIAVPYLKNKVTSMSGHTRDVLGAPTREWLLT